MKLFKHGFEEKRAVGGAQLFSGGGRVPIAQNTSLIHQFGRREAHGREQDAREVFCEARPLPTRLACRYSSPRHRLLVRFRMMTRILRLCDQVDHPFVV